jgi:hypothetical protein
MSPAQGRRARRWPCLKLPPAGADNDAPLPPAARPVMPATRLAPALLLIALLSGCEMLGIDSPEKLAALKEGEGKAVGSACRHANRAIEDCYALNAKAQKAAVFAGWREMDEYMRENKLEAVAPTIARPGARSEPLARAAADNTGDGKPGVDAEHKAAPAAGKKAVHTS